MNELTTFRAHRPDVLALDDAEREELWRRITSAGAAVSATIARAPGGADADADADAGDVLTARAPGGAGAADASPARAPGAADVEVAARSRAAVVPLHRRPATVAAAVLAVVAAGAVAVVLGGRSASTPASPPPVTQPTTTTVAVVTPVSFGSPPRLLLGDEWRLTEYNESGPGSGDLEFASTRPSADLTPGSVVVTAADGEVTTGDVTQAPDVIEGMWSTEDRTEVWSQPTITAATDAPADAAGLDDTTSTNAPVGVGGSVDGDGVADHVIVAGFPTTVFRYGPGNDHVAIIVTEHGSIELRFFGRSRAEVDAVLATVHAATPEEFAAALPDSVVAPQDRATAVDSMLDGVPLPDGADPAAVRDQAIYSGRDQLATSVGQFAVCAWLDRWFDATAAGDQAAVEQALAALESSHDWPVLTGIDPGRSGYPQQVWETIDTLRDGGTVMSGAGPVPITRPLAAGSLGCTW